MATFTVVLNAAVTSEYSKAIEVEAEDEDEAELKAFELGCELDAYNLLFDLTWEYRDADLTQLDADVEVEASEDSANEPIQINL